jgi:hypothetical protein
LGADHRHVTLVRRLVQPVFLGGLAWLATLLASPKKFPQKIFQKFFLALKCRTPCLWAVLHYPDWVPYPSPDPDPQIPFPDPGFGTPIEAAHVNSEQVVRLPSAL